MERDFTSECHKDFCTLVNQINDDNWCGVSDWFGDLFFSLKNLLTEWGWLDRTTEMETYYRELLDRKNTSEETVTQVFEDISGLDTSFASLRYLGYCKNYLDIFRKCLTDLSSLASDGSSGNLSSAFHPVRIRSMLGHSTSQLQRYTFSSQIYSLPAPEYQFTPSTFSEISQEDKVAFVKRCDTLCPELAYAIHGLFTDPDWTGQEKLDIKFILYNAPEPYRSIFFKNAFYSNTIVFQKGSKDSGGNDNSCFKPFGRTVYLEDLDSNLGNNPRAPYNTVFHEYGHAIDNAGHSKETYMSSFFWVGQDNLQYCIINDTRNYVNQQINRMCSEEYTGLTAEQKQLLLDDENRNILLASLNLAGGPRPYGGSDDGLPDELKLHRNLILRDMGSDLAGETNCAPSDVYGGVTNNAICSTYGHKGEKYEFYWYLSSGRSTNNQAAELWAEFYASQMTQDEEALASIKKHFPTAYPLLEEMARQLDPIPMAPT